MKKYLLFTSDGFIQKMDGVDIENCQVLGCAERKDFQETVKKLKLENAWFVERKFKYIKGYEVLSFQEVG